MGRDATERYLVVVSGGFEMAGLMLDVRGAIKATRKQVPA